MAIPDFVFRTLNPDENNEFRAWAHANWKRNKEPDPLWHPVVREEWNKISLIDAAAEAEEIFDADELEKQ